MTCTSNLLGRLAPTVESQLKPNLVGFTGFLVRGYLPQRWVFETGQERASLIVDIDGNTEVTLRVIESPYVLITTTHHTLSTALEAANGLRTRDSVIRAQRTPRLHTTH